MADTGAADAAPTSEEREWVRAALGDGRIICSECQATLDDIDQRCLYSASECQGYLAIKAAMAAPPPAVKSNVVDITTRQQPKPPPDPLEGELVDASGVDYSEERAPLEWVVDGLIPLGSVCLFSGEKELGKSWLLLDLLAAAALGQPWLGRDVGRRAGFGLFCEDSDRTVGLGQQVLEGRLARILRARGADFADLEGTLHWRSGVGRLSYIWESHRYTGDGKPSELWNRLDRRMNEWGTQILILDTRSHVYRGNTIDGYATAVFLNWLTAWATEKQGCVILTVHPPKDGSSRWAGCQEWSTVPRAHLHLQRPRHYDPETGEGRGERVLVQEKGNLSADRKTEVPIVWSRQNGLFVLDESAATPPTEHSFFGKSEFDMQVLGAVRSLIDDGAQVHALKAARWSLVKLVRGLPGFVRVNEMAILAAQDRLVERGDLMRVTVGEKVLVRPGDRRYAGE